MFTGPLYGINDLAERYRRSKIFVYPSIAEGGETFGLAVLEAMAWGCIPIVSDLNCFKDFVHHGTNGMVFNHRGPEPFRNLSSLILELSGNRILAEQLSTRALEVRLTHSLGAVARLFIKEFDLIAESNRKKHLS
jgi:glycosyltransferase involved in cell wall biosynthesis